MVGRRSGVWPIVGRVFTGTAAAAFACLSYSWFCLPDVRALIDRNPTTTAFMRLRAERTHRPPARVRDWVPYRRMSPLLSRAVLVAEDARFWSHDGVDLDELALLGLGVAADLGLGIADKNRISMREVSV